MKTKETFQRVNPRGTFFPTSPEDTGAQRPTTLRLGRYGFRRGDYVALARTGALHYGTGAGDTIKSLWMQSSNLGRRELSDQPFLFRWPGDPIQLCPQDTYYSDNSDPNGDYGVAISHINSRPPEMNEDGNETPENPSSIEKHNGDNDFIDELVIAARFHEDAARMAIAPFADLPMTDYPLQYRGWYLDERWNPAWSRFNGNRPGGIHKGIDVFLPRGTNLLAPTGGKLYLNPFRGGPSNPTFGRAAVIEYDRRGKKYNLIYSHLASVSGRSGRRVRSGDVVGQSGCSGNAGGNYPCGTMEARNEYGGRSDHVHVEIREGGIDVNAKKINPLSHFRWRIR